MKSEHLSDRQLMIYTMQEMTETEKKSMDLHLKSCEQCRKRVAHYDGLHALLKDDSLYCPPNDLLMHCRNRLKLQTARRNPLNRIEEQIRRILNLIPNQIETRKLVFAFSMILLGILIGRYGFSNRNNLSEKLFHEMVAGDVPVSQMEVLPASQVRFYAMEKTSVNGSFDDSDVQQLLANTLMYDSRDNLRFRTLDMIQNASQGETLEPALLYALQHDRNPGLRLRAIKILKDFPINPTMKNILIRILYQERNPAVRYKVAEKLSESEDPAIRPMLESQAKYDPTIRNYLAGHPQSSTIAVEKIDDHEEGARQ